MYARKTEHCATVALWTPAQEDEPHYISDMVLILMWYIFVVFWVKYFFLNLKNKFIFYFITLIVSSWKPVFHNDLLICW